MLLDGVRMKVVIIKGIVYVDSWSFDDFISNDHKGKNVKYNGKYWMVLE